MNMGEKVEMVPIEEKMAESHLSWFGHVSISMIDSYEYHSKSLRNEKSILSQTPPKSDLCRPK